MAERKIQLPDGRTATIEVPDNATDDQIQAFVASQFPAETPETPEQAAEGALPDISTTEKFTAAEQEANEILGVDPNIIIRGEILPFGRDINNQMVFAVPEIALGVARSLLLPGQAIQGTEITPRDVTTMALNVAAPAKIPGATRKITAQNKLTGKQIAETLNRIDLDKVAGKKFTASRQANPELDPDDYLKFLVDAEEKLVAEGADSVLHPILTRVFKILSDDIGKDLTAQDLHNIRRKIGIATESTVRDEARIGRKLRDKFDDFVERLPGTPEWIEARKLYIQARKAETVENAINRAGNAASGLENGLRNQFRSLLNNERKMRNFSKEERAAMQAVVDGDFTANTLKRIGKIGFGRGAQSNFLGGSIGIGAGGLLGGPVGGMVAPIVGAAASKGAESRTLKAVNALRALIGGARPEPKITVPGAIAAPLGAAEVASEGRQRAQRPPARGFNDDRA